MMNSITTILNNKKSTFLKGVIIFTIFVLFCNLMVSPYFIYKVNKNYTVILNAKKYQLKKYKIDTITTPSSGTYSGTIKLGVFYNARKNRLFIPIVKYRNTSSKRNFKIYSHFKKTVLEKDSSTELIFKNDSIYIWEYNNLPHFYGIKGEEKLDTLFLETSLYFCFLYLFVALLTIVFFIIYKLNKNEIK